MLLLPEANYEMGCLWIDGKFSKVGRKETVVNNEVETKDVGQKGGRKRETKEKQEGEKIGGDGDELETVVRRNISFLAVEGWSLEPISITFKRFLRYCQS